MKKTLIILSMITAILLSFYTLVNLIVINRIPKDSAYFEKFEKVKPVGSVYYAVPNKEYFIEYTTINRVYKTGLLSSTVKIDTIKADDMIRTIVN